MRGTSGLVVTTVESVTGGLVARVLCEVPGVSAVFRGGVVAYSNAWELDVVGAPADLVRREGPVSESAARAMAEVARGHFGVDWAIATTGWAGSDAGGAPMRQTTRDMGPSGTVHVAIAGPAGSQHRGLRFGLPRLATSAARPWPSTCCAARSSERWGRRHRA